MATTKDIFDEVAIRLYGRNAGKTATQRLITQKEMSRLANTVSAIPAPLSLETLESNCMEFLRETNSCFGVCQPQRPQRKHVDSTIVEPKQLT